MRLLVTGDRNWDDGRLVYEVLDAMHAVTPITTLIEGCARGADRMAGDHPPVYAEDNPMYPDLVPPGWAWYRHVAGRHYPAEWDRYHRAAGPIRNAKMLKDGRPEAAIAFHDDLAHSRGTRDMVRRLLAAGVPVTHWSHAGRRELTAADPAVL